MGYLSNAILLLGLLLVVSTVVDGAHRASANPLSDRSAASEGASLSLLAETDASIELNPLKTADHQLYATSEAEKMASEAQGNSITEIEVSRGHAYVFPHPQFLLRNS